jgi:tetratricopeptide (TPR) repeat protein
MVPESSLFLPEDQDGNSPTSAYYWKVQGNEFAKQGEYKDALRCYVTALRIDPEYIDAWHNTRLVLRKIGKKDEADRIADRIAELEEKHFVKKCETVISNRYCYKNPFAAALGSFVFPGLGQVYNMQVGKGLAFLIGTVAGLFLFIIPGIIFYVIGIYDAFHTSSAINAKGQPVERTGLLFMLMFVVLGVLIAVLTAVATYWIIDVTFGVNEHLVPMLQYMFVGGPDPLLHSTGAVNAT